VNTERHAHRATHDPILYIRKSDVAELEALLSREVLRIERVIEAGAPQVALRQLRPMLTHLRRARAGIRRRAADYPDGPESTAAHTDALAEISHLALAIARAAIRAKAPNGMRSQTGGAIR
jgi:hypothetical protein